MKKILFLALLTVMFFGCKEKPFTGYVVGKGYIPQHMDDKPADEHKVAIVVPHVVYVPHHHTPELVKAKFILYVANTEYLRKSYVDSLTFIRTHVKDKVTIYSKTK